MNVFDPLRTHPSSTRRAVVRIEPKASLPAPGSVSAHAPIFSIVSTGSAHFSFCSGVPRAITAPPNRPSDAPNARAKPGQQRESSIIKMAIMAACPSPRRFSRFSPVSPDAASAFASRSRIFANEARAMSGMPNVSAIARIVG